VEEMSFESGVEVRRSNGWYTYTSQGENKKLGKGVNVKGNLQVHHQGERKSNLTFLLGGGGRWEWLSG